MLAAVSLAVLLLQSPEPPAVPIAGDKSECKCGEGCDCKDGRKASDCTCCCCRCCIVAVDPTPFTLARLGFDLSFTRLANTPAQQSPRMVVLSDAWRFGVRYHESRALWSLAQNHAGRMRETITVNDPGKLADWEAECQWRARCWFLLDDAVNSPTLPIDAKLRSLEELRQLIGDVDFYAGRMPCPTPHYRMPKR